MTIYSRPDTTLVWASEGGLSAPSTEKYLVGWVDEKPPYEQENYVQNLQDKKLAYIFQEGIPQWHSSTEYSQNSLTKYLGVVYKALVDNLNKQPDVETASWGIAFDTYGSAAAVQDEVDEIKNTEGYLPLYVSKANPVMDDKAEAPSFSADVGFVSTESSNVGYSFQGDNNSGMFKDGTSVVIASNGVQVAKFPEAPIAQSDSTNSVATTAWVKQLIATEIGKVQIQVGESFITANPNNPSTYKGYGTWVQDLQGQALVGVSSSVSSTIPEWAKTVDSVFGEYNHELIVSELPKFKLKNGVADQQAGVDTSCHVYGSTTEDMPNQATSGVQNAAGQISYQGYTSEIGNNEAHNNVQPSKTKYIWTRVA